MAERTVCDRYTALRWSPTAVVPEDDRCVNCGQTRESHSRSREAHRG